MSSVEDKYLDLPRLSQYASMAIPTLRDYCRNKRRQLPHFKLRGKILVRRSEFDKWLEKNFRARPDVDINNLADEIVSDLRKGKSK